MILHFYNLMATQEGEEPTAALHLRKEALQIKVDPITEAQIFQDKI
jgi:hypothetical protein